MRYVQDIDAGVHYDQTQCMVGFLAQGKIFSGLYVVGTSPCASALVLTMQLTVERDDSIIDQSEAM